MIENEAMAISWKGGDDAIMRKKGWVYAKFCRRRIWAKLSFSLSYTLLCEVCVVMFSHY